MLVGKYNIQNLVVNYLESIDVALVLVQFSYVYNERDVEQDVHNVHVNRFHMMYNESRLIKLLNKHYIKLVV